MTDMSLGFCDISCTSNVPKVRIFPGDWLKEKNGSNITGIAWLNKISVCLKNAYK